MPLDPADVEDMRLRIEAHQRAADAEAASAKAFRSECERAHGEFLRAVARLEEERRARHAKQLEEMEVTYARARLARPAVSAEVIALRGLAQDIARGLAAREPARCGTPRPPFFSCRHRPLGPLPLMTLRAMRTLREAFRFGTSFRSLPRCCAIQPGC